jgi:protein MAK11
VSGDHRVLACGGDDERIHVFDLLSNKSMGELSQHTGAVTALRFFGSSYLISGSEDSSLCIWRASDWECVHILGGHKESISDLAVHPSGKLCLSVSKDVTLKLWNLVQGTPFMINL